MRHSQPKNLWFSFVCAFLFIIFIIYIFTSTLYHLHAPGQVFKEIPIQEGSIYETTLINPERSKQWKHIMMYNEIKSFVGLSQFEGLTDKYAVELEGGYIAIGKLVHPDTFVDTTFIKTSFQDPTFPDLIQPHRAYRRYQGWAETAASAVADIAFPGKKLPTTMRSISSTLLWTSEGLGSWNSWFKYWLLPERQIYISLSPYIHGVIPMSAPSINYSKYLYKPAASEVFE